MNKLGWVLLVVVLLMLAVSPVSAQDSGEIVIQPEGLLYSIIGTIIGLLSGAGVMYYRLKGSKPAQDLDENSRNGLFGALLFGGYLASLTPGQWDDVKLSKMMSDLGFSKPVWNSPHPPAPSPTGEGESVRASAWGLASKRRAEAPPVPDSGSVGYAYREAPPIGDTLEDVAIDWGVDVPDEETRG